MEARERIAEDLVLQGRHCATAGSPLYAHLLAAAAEDVRASGPTWDVLAPHADERRTEALPLRLLAGVHRLVLTRRAPALALHYPSVGGTAGIAGADAPFLATVGDHVAELIELAGRPLQTNEVGRAAALLPGFLAVARAAQRPLRVLEIGASAGLLLRWDRYRYTGPGWAWGPPDAPVVLDGLLRTAPEPWPERVEVAERRGCDRAPVDPTTEEGRLTLTAAVWPDQTARFERLRAALLDAARDPVPVDAEPVATWLPARLADPAPGLATVIVQSIVGQYLTPADRAAQAAALVVAGARATPDAPLAWLRFEPVQGGTFAVDLTTWPGGAERRIATAHPHGSGVAVIR